MATARTVKDVSPHEFVNAYSAHLKRSGKVYYISSLTYVYGVLVLDLAVFFSFGFLCLDVLVLLLFRSSLIRKSLFCANHVTGFAWILI